MSDDEVEQRGARGCGPDFNRALLEIRVTDDEAPARFERLKKNVEYRCPVMNLFRAAGVDVQAERTAIAP